MKLTTQWILLAYLSLFALGLSDNARGPLFPELLRYFSVSSTEGSFFYVLSAAMGLLGSYVSQPMIARIGKLQSLRASTLAMSLSSFSMSMAQEFWQLVLASGFFGFSIGWMGVMQNVLVLSSARPENMQRVQSGLHAMYAISSLLAPLTVAWTYENYQSWRATFVLTAILGAVAFLSCLFSPADPPQKANVDPGAVTRRGQKILVALVLGSYVVLELLVSTRLAQFVRDVHNMTLEQSSYYTTFFFVALLVGRLAFTVYHPKWTLEKQMTLSMVLSILFVALGIVSHPAWLAASGLAMAPFYPLTMTWAGSLFPKEISSVTSYMVAGSGTLLVSMHFSVGVLTDKIGIAGALWVGPAFGFLTLVLMSLHKKNHSYA